MFNTNTLLADEAAQPDWSKVQLTSELRNLLTASQKVALSTTISAYTGFGSFHSENVEDMIQQSDTECREPPQLPPFAKRILTKSDLCSVAAAGGSNDGASKNKYRKPQAKHIHQPRKRNAAMQSIPSGAPFLEGAGIQNGECTTELSDSRDTESFSGDSKDSSSELADAGDDRWLLVEALCNQPVRLCPMGFIFRDTHFNITKDTVFINHGAFGSSLSGAIAIKRWFEDLMEEEVVSFFDRKLLPLTVHSIRILSRFFHANPRQIVLLQNATFALNCAMRLIEEGDVVAFLDTEYLAVYKMMWFRCQEVGATYHEVMLSKYLHDETILGSDEHLTAEICRQLPEGCTVFIVDYITSTTAMCLPVFTHIIPALRRRGINKIIVDGAHTPLQIDLNFNSLPPECQPTVFAANLHKWFSSPKSVGVYWIKEDEVDNVRSVVVSHGAGEGLLSEFIWDGTRDYGAYLTIPAVVQFWEAQGCERVRTYCSTLLESAVCMLTSAFQSRRVARKAPFMSLVELPEALQDVDITGRYIQDMLFDIYRIEVPVKRVEGRYYLRISAFVYNTPAEYVYLREAVYSIAEKWLQSEERRKLQEIRVMEEDRKENIQPGDSHLEALKVPCTEEIRRRGGCGLSALEPASRRSKTRKFE